MNPRSKVSAGAMLALGVIAVALMSANPAAAHKKKQHGNHGNKPPENPSPTGPVPKPHPMPPVAEPKPPAPRGNVRDHRTPRPPAIVRDHRGLDPVAQGIRKARKTRTAP